MQIDRLDWVLGLVWVLVIEVAYLTVVAASLAATIWMN